MQAHFEGRFDTYLPLLSDRENSCDFITLLFNRIIHLFKEREWITDQTILNRFQASILKPTERTKEIYQILQKRIGSVPLEGLKNKVFIKSDKIEAPQIPPPTQLKVNDPVTNDKVDVVKPIPKIKMTHSRFSAELWHYVYGLGPATNNLYTKEGESLSVECKNKIKSYLHGIAEEKLEKQELLSYLQEIEKAEVSEFKEFLNSILNRIIAGDKKEELKRDLRKVRKYLINHSDFPAHKQQMGSHASVFMPLLGLLYPDASHQGFSIHPIAKSVIKNNRICFTSIDELAQNKWTSVIDDSATRYAAAGIIVVHKGHYCSYIYDGSNYVCHDQFKNPYKLTAVELHTHLKKLHNEKQSFDVDYIIFPESVELDAPINDKWVAPGWERNNCFIAASLMLLALFTFYKKQAYGANAS